VGTVPGRHVSLRKSSVSSGVSRSSASACAGQASVYHAASGKRGRTPANPTWPSSRDGRQRSGTRPIVSPSELSPIVRRSGSSAEPSRAHAPTHEPRRTRAHRHACMHSHTQTCIHARTHTHTAQERAHCMHTDTHIWHSNTQTYARTRTHERRHAHPHTHPHTCTHARTHTTRLPTCGRHTHRLAHTHTHTHPHAHRRRQAPAPAPKAGTCSATLSLSSAVAR
jgi:hypothetical protein